MSSILTNAPFFVVGSDRSGTTMLRLMLNEHSRLHVPRESWFISNLLDELPINVTLSADNLLQAYNIISSHPRWKEWEVSDEQLHSVMFSLESPGLRELVDAIFRSCGNVQNKARWGDKTPYYVREIERLHNLFPNAKFIHLIRDGRDVCLSLLSRKWQGESCYTIAEYWSDTIDSGIRLGRPLGSDVYREFSYEDLVENTGEVLTNICDFLGEQYQPNMKEFYKNASVNVSKHEHNKQIHTKTMRPPRLSDTSRWRKEMSAHQIALFEAIAGGAMDHVGQERRYKGFMRIIPFIARLFITIVDITRPIRQRLGLNFPGLRRKI